MFYIRYFFFILCASKFNGNETKCHRCRSFHKHLKNYNNMVQYFVIPYALKMRKIHKKNLSHKNKAIFHFPRFTRYLIVKPEATVITATTTTRILVLCFLIICVCHLTACYECIFIFVVQRFLLLLLLVYFSVCLILCFVSR